MHISRRSFLSLWAFFALLLTGAEIGAQEFGSPQLAQANTSSPQTTLQTFLGALDGSLPIEQKATISYVFSDRLYPNQEEDRLRAENDQLFLKALETLDLSGLPSGFAEPLAVDRLIRLAEVLSRIRLPAIEAVPDHEAMKEAGETRWRIPGSRIEIALITEGPREGEYLFSANTVVNLEEIHDRVAALPYKPGAVQRFVDGLKPYTSATSLYDMYRNSTAGFGILPNRWLFNMPPWFTAQIFGMTVWQWLSLAFYAFVGCLFVGLTWSICRRTGSHPQWRVFLIAVVVSVFAWFTIPLYATLHISGNVLYVTGITSVAVLYVSAAWAVFYGAGAVAETIINRQQLRVGGIDSELVRLGARLVGLAIGIALLLEGANELGFPAYSVLTGLGIGGLAVALAARETLANILGSIAIMFEKPFRSGHWIKVGTAEGTVEYVGFRSTRIRTFEDSLISIPNSVVVNAVVDNLGIRGRRRQRFIVEVPYGTPRAKVEAFIAGIRKVLAEHPTTDREDAYVHLNDLGESGMGVLLYFHLRVPDYAAELKDRESILLRIIELAEEVGVEFAFPTRTVHLGATPDWIESGRNSGCAPSKAG